MSRYRRHPQLTLDTSTVTSPISNMLPYPATAREPLGGYIVPGNGLTSSSAHNLNPTTIDSVPVHHAASPNLPSTAQASYRPMASSSVALIRDPPVRLNRTGTYPCHASGCKTIFIQKQGLNWHYREKHRPELWKVCPYCGVFTWSPARKYRYTKHLKIAHQESHLTK